ncbi:MAG: ABC transporter ATP-binding protein [Candidatus Thorarchaeota archaeon]|nr:MAG: ABC transporter ATP-binding protein [Candidatus Thorarchaeota archaeon]
MASAQSLVSITDLYKEYKLGETTVHALRGVSLEIADGEFVAILGQSGSGKTTLLNMISALDIPTSGDVVVEGSVISSMKRDERTQFRRTSVGLVFQFYNLFSTLTALENVEIGIAMKIKDKKEMRERGLEYLELVGILDKADNYPSQMSGGEQQRVAIARGLAKEPPILVLDEPTGNLDAETSDVIWELLQKLNKKTGTTVITVTHQTSVSKVADRSVFLRSGQVYGISERDQEE